MEEIVKRKAMRKLVWSLAIIVLAIILAFGIMIGLFPPKAPPALETIAAPFRSVDFSRMPAFHYYMAREGSRLAYRAYIAPQAKQVVVLIHGSSGSSRGMHPLAGYLHKLGMTVYSPDIRGHGDSGPRGAIKYIGQLEDDLEDFANQVLKQHEATLVGFSAGGGFVLRFAADQRQKLFARYILLSPYIGYDSPTVKPNSGGWADVSYPRYIGILFLGRIGEIWFGHLPVISFAIEPRTAKYLTPQYSYRLLRNFAPHLDYRSDMAAVKQPLTVLVGEKDELFIAEAFQPLFTELRPGTKVIIVPGAGHIMLTTGQPGMSAIAKAILP